MNSAKTEPRTAEGRNEVLQYPAGDRFICLGEDGTLELIHIPRGGGAPQTTAIADKSVPPLIMREPNARWKAVPALGEDDTEI